MPDQGNNPYVVKVGVSQLEITDAGHEYLNGMVTDSRGQVYAFHPQAVSPELVGAAMARLSRRPGDLRGAVLDEFAIAGPDAVAGLAGRVITQFGDDSVQRLVPIQFVVEGPSILLTKLLEWSRYVAALEQ